jgi:hypothetical protein
MGLHVVVSLPPCRREALSRELCRRPPPFSRASRASVSSVSTEPPSHRPRRSCGLPSLLSRNLLRNPSMRKGGRGRGTRLVLITPRETRRSRAGLFSARVSFPRVASLYALFLFILLFLAFFVAFFAENSDPTNPQSSPRARNITGCDASRGLLRSHIPSLLAFKLSISLRSL